MHQNLWKKSQMQQIAIILPLQKAASSAKKFFKKTTILSCSEIYETTRAQQNRVHCKKMEEVAFIGDYYTYGYRE